MPDDPLNTGLDDWTPECLQGLLGRRENERLELKGSRSDVITPDGRKQIARAVAAMTSTAGGFIIIGGNDGDTLTSLPGISSSDELERDLVNSIRDSVRPLALIRGPRRFPADDPELSVLVLQVFPHPAGLPASANGRFWMRSGESTVPMDYSEVRRRFVAAADVTDAASKSASEQLDKTDDLLDIQGPIKPPFGVAISPRFLGDLGKTANEIRRAISKVWELERPIAQVHFAGDFIAEVSSHLKTGHGGIHATDNGLGVLTVAHDGAFAGSYSLVLDAGTKIGIDAYSLQGARYMALGILAQRALTVPGEAHVILRSGPLFLLYVHTGIGLSTESMSEPGTTVNYSFELPLHSGTPEAAIEGLRVFCDRIFEGLIGDRTPTSVSGQAAAYLREVLA